MRAREGDERWTGSGFGACWPAVRPHVHRLVLDFGLVMVLATDLCAISGGVACVAAIREPFVI